MEANISHVVASSASLDPVERFPSWTARFQATGSMEFREKPYLYIYIYIKPRFPFANFRECDSCSPGREIEFVLLVPSCGSRIFISNSGTTELATFQHSTCKSSPKSCYVDITDSRLGSNDLFHSFARIFPSWRSFFLCLGLWVFSDLLKFVVLKILKLFEHVSKSG